MEETNNTITPELITAPVTVPTAPTDSKLPEPPKEREVAYVINDKYFSGFEVVKSANGFWMERGKVEGLISSLKTGLNIKQACIYNDISIDQYKYFVSLHPNFSTVKEACEERAKILIEAGINAHLEKQNPTMIMWAAERRIPEKYGKNLAEGGGGGPINNFGTIVQVTDSVAAKLLKRRENLKPEQNG